MRAGKELVGVCEEIRSDLSLVPLVSLDILEGSGCSIKAQGPQEGSFLWLKRRRMTTNEANPLFELIH